MFDLPNIVRNGELSHLKTIKDMAQLIDTSIENTKAIYQDAYETADFSPIIKTTTTPLILHPKQRPNIVHFFGSTQDEFYNGVSLYYMRDAYKNLIEREESPVSQSYTHILLHSHPDGNWSFPKSLSDNDIHAAVRVSLETVISMVKILKPVAAAPYMFCMNGMTTIRGLFEMLGVPVIGNTAESMALSTNKWQTRCILKSAGVPVADGEPLTHKNDMEKLPMPTLEAPFIVKPCTEGNSLGLSMYKGNNREDLALMVQEAFKYDKEVLVEKYIPLGYEVRVAVVEDVKGNLKVLPICNYILQDSNPIRTLEDKLQTDKEGVPTTPTKCLRELPAQSLPTKVVSSIEKHAIKAHSALGCRDYSIFDIRVSPEGTPYFIEASLYCCYASTSIIVLMSEAAGQKPYELFKVALERTINRHSDRKQKNCQN